MGMSLFSLLIYICYEKLELEVGVPLSVLGSVSVALGLLLAFRVNTAYERYNNGRCLIQTVTATIRNLSRQIWINVPENSQEDHIQKMRCIKLLLAFFVATKHHLRHEYGTDYYDLQELLPRDWVPASVTYGAKPAVTRKGTHSISKLNIRQTAHNIAHGMKSAPLVVSLHDTIKPLSRTGSLNPDHPNDVHNMRRSLIKQFFPDTDIADSSAASIQKSAVKMAHDEDRQQRRKKQKSSETQPLLPTSVNTYASSNSSSSSLSSPPPEHGDRSPFTSEEDLQDNGDGDISLPLEILYRIALYINAAKAAGKIESNFVSVTTSSLDTLVNTLTAFERIVHTPIPKAYNIHLKQGVVLYIFFLPFSLVESLGLLVIPIVSLVTFTLFGILAIGEEIENPFGYDYNDLPLNRYCDDLKREVEYIIYHVPSQSNSILLDGQ
ncbi:Bestrophin, RFP-TM, chloride channel-domain-containing protein [Halteromyces radiatus]|uniref:Bestrophin, RFP-TM, chloride channel-domain-containing protein n=1 Tax=Halteromyces radiatus TaxID=101107 RepID=UPI00221F3CA8|nr:Bestrophin, RFP-TM, chloride channel-domain-containing protein [Halteromyces radiatus]KAI8078739.1 Bestrophin, RFP-TM, chloride channel-domain-containing protein [Halteromyces radiatus]